MQSNNEKSPLPVTIEMRALEHMAKGVEEIEAVKMAFEEEERTAMFAASGTDIKTGRMHTEAHKSLLSEMCSRVYHKIKSANP